MLAIPLSWRIAAALAAVLFVAGVYGAGWHKGHAVAEAACEAAAIKAQLAEEQRQRKAAEEALKHANELYDEQAREIAALESEAEAYVHMLEQQAPPGSGVCVLSDDDARRLRAIH